VHCVEALSLHLRFRLRADAAAGARLSADVYPIDGIARRL
jgi:hypothetical protein